MSEQFVIQGAGVSVLWAPLARTVHLLDGPGDPGCEVDEGEPPQARPPNAPLRPSLLGFIPTRACNLDCLYCDFGGDKTSSAQLNRATAVGAVDWYTDLCDQAGIEVVRVEFFGGEPLLMPDLVRSVAERARERVGRRAHLQVLSNGVMPDPTRRLLAEHFDHVMLSVDGPADVHDRTRARHDGSGSWTAVAETAEALDGALAFRVCVTAETARRMPEIAADLIQFRPKEVAFEPLWGGRRARRSNLEPPRAVEFVQGFLGASDVLLAAGITPVHGTSMLENTDVSFCPVGRDACIVHPDGSLASCYLQPMDWRARGLELTWGHLNGPIVDHQALAATRRLNVHQKPRCTDCFARWQCAGGCHVHHTWPGCSRQRDERCAISRMLVFASLLRVLGQQDALTALARNPRDPKGRRVGET